MSRTRRVTLAALGACAVLLAAAGPAWAHVTVTAPGATSGGSDQQITFRVPVEENQDTVAVTIQLPTDTPIASVLVDPIPGWTHTQTTSRLAKPITTDDGTITEAVSQISWTAGAGAALKPGEYGEFTIIAGQLPKASSLTFKALQTYADGSVVKWIEVPAPGSTVEPDHPAPVLSLSGVGAGSTGPTPAAVTATATPATAPAANSGNTGAVILSIAALVVAVAALALGVVSRARAKAGAS